MSVKSFKFVSPGVFINEIDNSFIPRSADVIGPVVVGRSTRGLALQPTKVESYSEFVEVFGDTMPGNMGGDVYRDGNGQSPMYGTYAAKAFLNANVGPVTYMRLLGAQHTDATSTGYCGWKTNSNGTANWGTNGGAYGLWIFASASTPDTTPSNLGIGNLAAVWYVDNSSSVTLEGIPWGASSDSISSSLGAVIGTTTDGLWTVHISGATGDSEKFKFNFDDSSQNFIRKVFNTNPQLGNLDATDFYNSAVRKTYWLGETYEQTVRTGYQDSLTGSSTDQTSGLLLGVMQALNLSGAAGTGPQAMTNPTGGQYVEGKAGWFVGQDLGATAPALPAGTRGSTEYNGLTKLFRLVGRGHGEWLQKHAKVSIENIRISTSAVSEYGSFSILIRHINDTDSNVIVLERFDNLTLNPASPDFVARRIGNMYYVWSDSERRLKQYGEFPNQSKFIYVDANEDILDGSAPASLLPFGYYGPPRFSSITDYSGAVGQSATVNKFISPATENSRLGYVIGTANTVGDFFPGLWRGNLDNILTDELRLGGITGSFHFPRVRLRNSASDAGMSDPRNAYFGMQTTRSPSSTVADPSIADYHRMLYSGMPDDPSSGGITGVDGYAYIFTLDDIALDNVTATYSYVSGSRNNPQNGLQSYTALSGTSGLLDAGYDKFTAPFFGGFDAVNIYKPDPFYNAGMTEGASTELNDYIYNTYKRAIDTVSDPEFINMNLLTTPGLTIQSLTTHEVRVCEERADALALIDLPLVYRPPAEAKLTKPNRVATTPDAAATALRNRQIDSSYGCTFYPWVQTLDEPTSQLLWIPPTVAMLGVLASSQAKSDIWFAPAGFNRGGLTDGAAGIPITNVTERLTSKQRDTLYENSINPIASFPSTGIVLFGQKTLQQRQSALDRINVRRLVIFLKKQISILATQVLFEQNVQATWDAFVALVNPLLVNTKIGFGISDYKLILDDTTTTPDLIDQNILYAKIMVKPARAIEYIAIDFVIMSTGASFDD